jgi:hypothetical protein
MSNMILIVEVFSLIGIYTMMCKSLFKWTGHVVHMSGEQLQQRKLFGELVLGMQTHDGSKMRYKDILKVKNCGIDIQN